MTGSTKNNSHLNQQSVSPMFPMSPIIMGTWQAGKSYWVGIQDDQILSAIHAALDHGITTFDTAPAYGDGHAESLLGKALKGKTEPSIITKVSPGNCSFSAVIESCHASLIRLNRDVIDLLLIHWPSGSFKTPVIPISETMRALNQLKTDGKIKAIGLSNFSLDLLIQAQSEGQIDAIQYPYSLFWRHIEDELLGYCNRHSIPILAYSPLAQGLLTGRFKPGHIFERGDHRKRNLLFKPHLEKAVHLSLKKLGHLAQKKQVSMAQLALAWLASKPHTFPIVGCRNASQIIDSAKAAHLRLDPLEQETLLALSDHVVQFLDKNPILWR